MIRRPPRSTRTDTLFPYPTLFRHAAADRVWILRGMIDAVFQARSRTWVLASSFTSHVGHFVYAATLLELQRRGRLAAQEIGILPGPSQNGFLRQLFKARVLAAAPADTAYVEMISARKRHRPAERRWCTIARKSVGEGKSVSGRVGLGGRSIHK